MRRPKTVEEYVNLVKDAVFEVDDLRACLEYELDDLTKFPVFLDPLAQGVKALYQSMQAGTYAWGREDLPFMAVMKKHELEIPFTELLELINETHKRGLDVEGEGA